MNPQTQPLELSPNMDSTAITDMDLLAEQGFTTEETLSVLWLRQWYQSGGSDRVEIVRHLEFLKLLVLNGKMDV